MRFAITMLIISGMLALAGCATFKGRTTFPAAAISTSVNVA